MKRGLLGASAYFHFLPLMVLLSPEGGGGDGGGGNPDSGDGGGKPPAPAPDPKPDPKPKGEGDDTSGLKSALEKERAARKEAEKSAKELKGQIDELTGKVSKLGELESQLGTYRLKESRSNAIDEAIKGLGEDFTVDRSKVEALAADYNDPETVAEKVKGLVDILKSPKASDPAPGGPKPGLIKGQPPAPKPNVDTTNLTKLYRENPEAYKAYVAQQRQKTRFVK